METRQSSKWPTGQKQRVVRLQRSSKLLGPAGDHEVEMVSILADHGLPLCRSQRRWSKRPPRSQVEHS